MSGLAADAFYNEHDEAPQQGDILLGAVARVVGTDDFAPLRWRLLDEARAELLPTRSMGRLGLPAVRVAAGRALVMVTTHDCGMDKEFNAAVTELMGPDGTAMSEEAAMRRAEDRDDLDRSFQVSPLVDPGTVHVAGNAVELDLLMAGRIIGYLPVPELVVNGRLVIPASVVDLGYRTTLDRLAYTQRITCISEQARQQLRYALARMDVLRSPSLEAALSDAIGQRIVKARVHKKNPLLVQLSLEDGGTVELMRKPGSPPAGAPARTRRSVRPT